LQQQIRGSLSRVKETEEKDRKVSASWQNKGSKFAKQTEIESKLQPKNPISNAYSFCFVFTPLKPQQSQPNPRMSAV